MFSINELKQMQGKKTCENKKKNKTIPNIYTNTPYSNEIKKSEDENTNMSNIEIILEKEKQKNKMETWNKLNKTIKIQKLHDFSEKYGKEKGYNGVQINMLKEFFTNCLEKNRLQKSKDLIYNKDTQEIVNIPSLHFNTELHNYTLKNIEKRVSTLKSLTPKKTTNSISQPTPIIVIDETNEHIGTTET